MSYGENEESLNRFGNDLEQQGAESTRTKLEWTRSAGLTGRPQAWMTISEEHPNSPKANLTVAEGQAPDGPQESGLKPPSSCPEGN